MGRNNMKITPWIAAIVVTLCGACTWVDGECWLRSEDGTGSGAGGGPLVPGGGGYGDVPPTPQDANDPPPPPECLQVPQGACYQKCLKDYEAASAECGKVEDASQRNVCQMSAYTAYKICRDNCQKQTDKDACVLMFDACQDKGPPCNKEVDVGKTLCAFCLDDCIAKRPYKYSECYQCGFE